jgi:hypothetical protein
LKKCCLFLAIILLLGALVSCGKAAKEVVPSANGTGSAKPAENRTDDAQVEKFMSTIRFMNE